MAVLLSTSLTNHVDGGVCFCCRRQDDGIGYFKLGRPPRIVWACKDHIHLLSKALAMPQREFNLYEKRSAEAAGAVAGQLLDQKFGKTDLASLATHEWLEFCETLVKSFGDDLAKRLANHEETPF